MTMQKSYTNTNKNKRNNKQKLLEQVIVPNTNVACSILRCKNNDTPFLILSKNEIESMLEICKASNDNVILCYDHNEIGTTYGVTSQSLWNSVENKNEIGLADITDTSNW